jgi:hypothetical protein
MLQKKILYAPVFKRNYIPNNLHCSHPLNIKAAVKQTTVIFRMAFFDAQSG